MAISLTCFGRDKRAILPFILGRKNYVLARPAASAPPRSTPLLNRKLNGLDPEAYSRKMLGRIAELLPWEVDLAPAVSAAA